MMCKVLENCMDTTGHQKASGIWYSKWLDSPHLASLELVPQLEILLEMAMISLLYRRQPQVCKNLLSLPKED